MVERVLTAGNEGNRIMPGAPTTELERKPPLDVGKAFKYRLKGLSYREIGELLGGYADSTVCDALQAFTKLLANPELVQSYRENEAELLDAVRAKIISTISDDIDIPKGQPGALSGYQKTGMFGIFFDKARLLRGESTVNLNSLSALVVGAAKDFAKSPRETNAVSEPQNEPIDVTQEPKNIS